MYIFTFCSNTVHFYTIIALDIQVLSTIKLFSEFSKGKSILEKAKLFFKSSRGTVLDVLLTNNLTRFKRPLFVNWP